MINYSRLGYEIKRDVTNFSTKISKGLKCLQQKFVHQMLYGILAVNKVHFSEIVRSLNENITLKKTIDRLSRNLNSFEEKQSVMQGYIGLTSCVHEESIYLKELKECSKRIYEIPKFIFYALGYSIRTNPVHEPERHKQLFHEKR